MMDKSKFSHIEIVLGGIDTLSIEENLRNAVITAMTENCQITMIFNNMIYKVEPTTVLESIMSYKLSENIQTQNNIEDTEPEEIVNEDKK